MEIAEIIGQAEISSYSERQVGIFIQYYQPQVTKPAERIPLGWIWTGYINIDTEPLTILTVTSRANYCEAMLQCAILRLDGILRIREESTSLIRIEEATREYARKHLGDWQFSFGTGNGKLGL